MILKVNKTNPKPADLRAAAEILKSGGIAVIPTDTVYGLAANAFNLEAQKKIYALKGRSFRKPLIIMPPDIEALTAFAEVSERTRRVMDEFWPGPLTLVLPATPLGSITMGGRRDLGARIPKHPVVLALLEECGFPLATTSANPAGKHSAKSGTEAARYFKDAADIILDAGAAEHSAESTVLDMTHFHCVVVREGCLPSKKLLRYM